MSLQNDSMGLKPTNSGNYEFKSVKFLDLPTELLIKIFELVVQEDLQTVLKALFGTPSKYDRLFQIVRETTYSSIIVTNYSRNQFHILKNLKNAISTYKVDHSILWSLDDLLNNGLAEIPSLTSYLLRKVHYIFGNENPVESIHKVMRQFCKYLNRIPHKLVGIPSEIILMLNLSPSFDTVYEFKKNFQDLNFTFLNHVIGRSSVFDDLHCLKLRDGIYYSITGQTLDLENIENMPSLQELNLNNLNLQSVENLRLPSSLLSLDLSNNHIANICDIKLPNTIKVLNLSHNNITFVQRSFFPDSIQTLNLGYNRLNFLSGAIFPDSVDYLDLSNNFIEDINFLIPEQTTYLNLRSCPIKSISYQVKTAISNNGVKVDL